MYIKVLNLAITSFSFLLQSWVYVRYKLGTGICYNVITVICNKMKEK